MRTLAAILVLTVPALAGPIRTKPPSVKAVCQPGPGTTTSFIDIANDAVAPYTDDKKFSAVAIGIVLNNASEPPLFYGETKIGNKKKPDAKTLFQIGSITKTFTGLLWALLDGDKVHLDQSVDDLLPTGFSLNRDRESMKPIDLLTHRAGLAKNSCIMDCPSKKTITMADDKTAAICQVAFPFFWATVTSCPLVASVSGAKQAIRPDEVVPLIDFKHTKHDDLADTFPLGPRTTETTVGAQYHYSNVGIAAAGRLLEKAYGKTWEALVKERITDALDLRDTYVDEDLTSDQRDRRAFPNGKDGHDWLFGFYPIMNPAAALYTTANDMARYLLSAMGVLAFHDLDAAMKKAEAAVFTDAKAGHRVGLTWEHSSILDGDCADMVWKGGDTPGFHAFIGFVPTDKNGVFVLTNFSSTEDGAIAEKVGRQILRALHGLSATPLLPR